MKNYIQKKNILILLFLIICLNGIPGLSQVSQKEQKITLDDAQKRPELGIDFLKISKLKIYLPKETYHLQETMTIDLGLLINNKDNYFYPKNLPVKIIILDNQENRVLIDTIYSIDKSPEFAKLKNTIVKDSIQLLIGCQNKIMQEIDQSAKLEFTDDINIIFEKDLFKTLPNGCIDINKGTDLTIYVEVYNDLVVIPLDKNITKTAIGKIRSNTFNIKILN